LAALTAHSNILRLKSSPSLFAGYTFGADIAEQFLHTNNLNHILRAHQLCMEGFQVLFDNKLSTVWSAPNYCYRCGNVASALEIDENLEFFFNVFGPSPEGDIDKVRRKPIPSESILCESAPVFCPWRLISEVQNKLGPFFLAHCKYSGSDASDSSLRMARTLAGCQSHQTTSCSWPLSKLGLRAQGLVLVVTMSSHSIISSKFKAKPLEQ
jgi:hypothetical protein